MLVRALQFRKAPIPMLVTGLPLIVGGMVRAPDAFSSQPVIVIESPWASCFNWGLTGASSVGLFSATGLSGLTSSLGAVGFSPTDSKPSGDDFSPQPPRRRGSDTDKSSTGLIIGIMPAA